MERHLDLKSLVVGLHKDGLLSDEEHSRLSEVNPGSVHPLVFLAEQGLTDESSGKPLDMERLGAAPPEWTRSLAERLRRCSGEEVLRIMVRKGRFEGADDDQDGRKRGPRERFGAVTRGSNQIVPEGKEVVSGVAWGSSAELGWRWWMLAPNPSQSRCLRRTLRAFGR